MTLQKYKMCLFHWLRDFLQKVIYGKPQLKMILFGKTLYGFMLQIVWKIQILFHVIMNWNFLQYIVTHQVTQFKVIS